MSTYRPGGVHERSCKHIQTLSVCLNFITFIKFTAAQIIGVQFIAVYFQVTLRLCIVEYYAMQNSNAKMAGWIFWLTTPHLLGGEPRCIIEIQRNGARSMIISFTQQNYASVGGAPETYGSHRMSLSVCVCVCVCVLYTNFSATPKN